MTGFCAYAWQHTDKLHRAMIELPFNAELAAGTLSRQRFQFYMVQDSRYLTGFGRALAVAAARAGDQDDIAFFSGAARESIVVERALHNGFFQRFGMSEADQAAVETSPACLAYTSFLLATAQTADYPELIAALLPCFWVYQDVGTEILARQQKSGADDMRASGADGTHASGVPDNPYQDWIDTYADDEFAASVRSCQDAVDRAAAAGTEHTRARMLAAFTRATEYEWLFWDSAYRLETWPTAGLRES